MTYNQLGCTLPEAMLEQIAEQGFAFIPELLRIVLNATMWSEREQHLGAARYERSTKQRGYANGYKSETVTTRARNVTFDVPWCGMGFFYPSALEKGLRSERALKLALAEMYVQGVSTTPRYFKS